MNELLDFVGFARQVPENSTYQLLVIAPEKSFKNPDLDQEFA
ncbi:MAG TPA: hypothetical protein VE732_08035 [Nitrososphaera sp.]|nr:hypothetical protein [Nitrososphaera sp.]